jgi:L-aminopeptidase/D-esterase-like protein
VDAVVIAGGSVYGLAAADGVAAWLGAQGRGYGSVNAPGVPRAPIVPAAILYDLANGGDKDWGLEPPYRQLGLAAVQSAGRSFSQGSAGAGAGAMAGRLKGGVGSVSIVTAEGPTVGALAAVNSFGSVVAPGGRAFWAAPYEIGAEFGGVAFGDARAGPDDWALAKRDPAPRSNTTLAVVATDAILTPAEARRIAIMAQDGLARAIRPAHAPFDGDVVFVVSTGRLPLAEPKAASLSRLGALAADCVTRAIARGVFEAVAWPGSDATAWRDLA